MGLANQKTLTSRILSETFGESFKMISFLRHNFRSEETNEWFHDIIVFVQKKFDKSCKTADVDVLLTGDGGPLAVVAADAAGLVASHGGEPRFLVQKPGTFAGKVQLSLAHFQTVPEPLLRF